MMTARRRWQDPGLERPPRDDAFNPQPRVLVVDDEPLIRQFISRVLLVHGYQVDQAEDGQAAWHRVNDEVYDLLITDNDMPRWSGLELLKQLHAARLALPSIMVSAALPIEALRCHPWLQVDATLNKPFSSDELMDAVRRVLALARAA